MDTFQVSAQEEFARNPELKEEDLKTLRTWKDTQPHIPHMSDEQLILFLHSCFYNMDKTKVCIDKYYSIKANIPRIFSQRELGHPENIKMLNVMRYAQLPVKDPSGCHILFHSMKISTPSEYMFPHALRLFFMMADACLVWEGTSPGAVVILDSTGVKFGHILRLSIPLIKKSLAYVQDAIPMRLKAVHVINTIPVIDHILFIIKPFMNKELYNLIHFHKGNNETLYDYIPKECLPKEYGGDLPTLDELHDDYVGRLDTLENYFKEEEKWLHDIKK